MTDAALTDRVVVVGASMGGLRAAEAARKAGFTGEVVVFGDEARMPYNRPPLSKDALDGRTPTDTLEFRVPRHAQDVTWRLGETVVQADLTERTVTTQAGDVLAWSGLVAATGLRPRRLDLPGPTRGRYVIRTVEDAETLRARLVPGARLVVIGAGFIGCEVAATARRLGVEVDVVAPEQVPMERPLGTMLGAALQRRHEAQGVRFHFGRLPSAVLGDGAVTGVRLDDGTELAADLLVEAVGCIPNVEWLDGNGLDLRDGLACDGQLRVEGRSDLVACGDIARFPNALFDAVPRRVEHWTMVTDTARKAGHTLGSWLAGSFEDSRFAPVPSFWSDQYDVRIQSFGAVGLGGEDVRVIEGDLDDEVAVGYYDGLRLVGVVMVGLGGRHMAYREQIAALGV
jgi:NADPH-dependent 2,4-dienoyl-CoA reductase/sulfur reductase-like enzyme